jgi:hypothetical protein
MTAFSAPSPLGTDLLGGSRNVGVLQLRRTWSIEVADKWHIWLPATWRSQLCAKFLIVSANI